MVVCVSLFRRGNRILTDATSSALGRQKEVRKRQNDREISEAVQLDWEICLAVVGFRIVYLRLDAYGVT